MAALYIKRKEISFGVGRPGCIEMLGSFLHFTTYTFAQHIYLPKYYMVYCTKSTSHEVHFLAYSQNLCAPYDRPLVATQAALAEDAFLLRHDGRVVPARVLPPPARRRARPGLRRRRARHRARLRPRLLGGNGGGRRAVRPEGLRAEVSGRTRKGECSGEKCNSGENRLKIPGGFGQFCWEWLGTL